MAQRAFTDADHRAVYDLVCQHRNVVAAAKAAGVIRSTFESRWRVAKYWAIDQGLPIPETGPLATAVQPSPRLPKSSDEAWAVIDGYIGRTSKKPTYPTSKYDSKRPQRIVIASDFHAPFHDPWCVAELIKRESGKTDQLIIGGDFTDSYSASKFIRYERIDPAQEWAACDALMGQLSRVFPDIAIIQGNHDARLEKFIRANLPPEVVYSLEQLADGPLDPLRVLQRRYKNVRLVGHTVGRHGMGWLTQIGDIVVSHAEKYSKVPSSVLRTVDEWFVDKEDEIGLKPWRVLAQAHTHTQIQFPWRSNKYLAEIGCMCETHGYQLQAKANGRGQRRGYMTCVQTNGVTDVNSIRLVWLDADRERAA